MMSSSSRSTSLSEHREGVVRSVSIVDVRVTLGIRRGGGYNCEYDEPVSVGSLANEKLDDVDGMEFVTVSEVDRRFDAKRRLPVSIKIKIPNKYLHKTSRKSISPVIVLFLFSPILISSSLASRDRKAEGTHFFRIALGRDDPCSGTEL